MDFTGQSHKKGFVADTQGTWPFWAPEMCDEDTEDEYDAYAADVWATGVCIWIIVFGAMPFWGMKIHI